MTLLQAQKIARELGYSIRKTGWDQELKVVEKGLVGEAANKAAYFTDYLDDAVDTMKAMARQRLQQGMEGVQAS